MDQDIRGTALDRARRRHRIQAAAAAQDGVLSRRQLYALGVTRSELRAELRAGRWRRLGPQSVRVAESRGAGADWWRAVIEVGPHAALDGSTALIAAGLRTIDANSIHVAVPKSSRPRGARDVVVHETRRYRAEDVIRDGIPRVKPAVAAVHAVLWARSGRQAVLFAVAAAQQRIVDPQEFAVEAARVLRHDRRRLLQALVQDVQNGIESVGEWDFARLCRARGLPEPSRQVLRRSPTGRLFLDTFWDGYNVTVEIDGIQHLEAHAVIADSLKANLLALEGGVVLRIPVVALRTDPEPFLDQVEAALRQAGWQGPARYPLRPKERAL